MLLQYNLHESALLLSMLNTFPEDKFHLNAFKSGTDY